jgi:hypothetical protein
MGFDGGTAFVPVAATLSKGSKAEAGPAGRDGYRVTLNGNALDRFGALRGPAKAIASPCSPGFGATSNLKVTLEGSVRNPIYSVPVTFAIKRSDTIAISSVP